MRRYRSPTIRPSQPAEFCLQLSHQRHHARWPDRNGALTAGTYTGSSDGGNAWTMTARPRPRAGAWPTAAATPQRHLPGPNDRSGRQHRRHRRRPRHRHLAPDETSATRLRSTPAFVLRFITSDTTLTVSGSNGALAAGEKIQVSSDGGTTWSDVPRPRPRAGAWSTASPTPRAAPTTARVDRYRRQHRHHRQPGRHHRYGRTAVAITTIDGGDNLINAAEAAGGIQISGTARSARP